MQIIIDAFNTYQYFKPFIVVWNWMSTTEVHIGLLHTTFMDIAIFVFLSGFMIWVFGFALGLNK